MVPLDKGLQWGNVKQMPDLGIFTHIPAYSGIIRHLQAQSGLFNNYSGMLRTLCNSGIFGNLVYSEPWHSQNQKIFQDQKHIQNPGLFSTLVYSEPWYI